MADDLNSIELATELTVAWLGNHNTRVHVEDVPTFLKSMHDAVTGLSQRKAAPEPAAELEAEYPPAVSARKSLGSPDHNHVLEVLGSKWVSRSGGYQPACCISSCPPFPTSSALQQPCLFLTPPAVRDSVRR